MVVGYVTGVAQDEKMFPGNNADLVRFEQLVELSDLEPRFANPQPAEHSSIADVQPPIELVIKRIVQQGFGVSSFLLVGPPRSGSGDVHEITSRGLG